MTAAVWMACVVIGGLLTAVACVVTVLAIGAWVSERRHE